MADEGPKKASEVLAELQALAGPSYYNRIDIRFAREGYDEVKSRHPRPTGRGGAADAGGPATVVERVTLETDDGFKFYRSDGSWLLIRFSGTEALLRVYVEARSPEDVDALLGRGPAHRRGGAAAGRGRRLMDARDYFGYKNPDEEPGRPDPADGTDPDRVPLFEEAVTLDDPSALRRIDPRTCSARWRRCRASWRRRAAWRPRWSRIRGCPTSTR